MVRYKNKIKTNRFVVVLLLIVCLIGVVLSYESIIGESIYKSTTIQMDQPFRNNFYTFRVYAPKNKNVYVYIRKRNDKTILTAIVKKDECYDLHLPKGEFDIYYAIGNKWINENELFGVFTKCYIENAEINTYDIKRSKSTVVKFEPMNKTIERISRFRFGK